MCLDTNIYTTKLVRVNRHKWKLWVASNRIKIDLFHLPTLMQSECDKDKLISCNAKLYNMFRYTLAVM